MADDDARAAPPPEEAIAYASPAGRWIMFVTILGSAIGFLDGTVVNVALPDLSRDLDADVAAVQWTVNGYLLTLAGLILLGGGLGDRYGRRRIFVIGVVWFAAASALCGVAQDSAMLIAARALQGVGGALLTPGSLALCSRPSGPRTGPRRSARGRGSAGSRARSGRSWAAIWSTGPAGGGSSSSTCRSRRPCWPSRSGTCRRAGTVRRPDPSTCAARCSPRCAWPASRTR